MRRQRRIAPIPSPPVARGSAQSCSPLLRTARWLPAPAPGCPMLLPLRPDLSICGFPLLAASRLAFLVAMPPLGRGQWAWPQPQTPPVDPAVASQTPPSTSDKPRDQTTPPPHSDPLAWLQTKQKQRGKGGLSSPKPRNRRSPRRRTASRLDSLEGEETK